MEFKYMDSRKSKSPAIAEGQDLSYFRKTCDYCMEPPALPVDDDDDDDELTYGLVTVTNADKRNDLRDLADLALKFYNNNKLRNFKLVKVCKINIASQHYCLTFRAREDGSEECPLFRGAVFWVGGEKPVFCEIKEDEEITLLPGDDDYVSPKESCYSKDSSPFI